MAKTPNSFVNLQNYLNANQGAIHNTANTLVTKDTQAAENAQKEAQDVSAAVKAQATTQGTSNAFDQTQANNYAQAQLDQSNAAQNLAGLGTTQGVNTQLQAAYGGKGGQAYTQGDRGFDAGLLGASGDAQGQFKDAQNRFSGLDHYLQDSTTQAYADGTQANTDKHTATRPTTMPVPKDPMDDPNRPYKPENPGGTFKDFHKPIPGRYGGGF